MKARESRYVTVARLAYGLAQASLPRYTHPKSPHRFTFPQRAACGMLMFYLNLSYRDMEAWLLATDQVRQVLGLTEVPDHSTLERTFKRLCQREWDALKQHLLAAAKLQEAAISVDTTNFRLSHASAYYQTRTGRTYRDWVKGGYAVGTQAQWVLGWRSGRGASNDAPYLEPLRRQARRYGKRVDGKRAWHLLGDMGFDGKTARPDDLIPPQRRTFDAPNPIRRARAELVD